MVYSPSFSLHVLVSARFGGFGDVVWSKGVANRLNRRYNGMLTQSDVKVMGWSI